MFKKIITAITIVFSLFSSAQIQFADKILINKDITPQNINDFQVLDFDNDGDLDIVTISSENNKKISLYKNEGNDRFSQQLLISTTSNFTNTNDFFLKVVDINNDGYLDLITNGLNRINIFINNGSNNFSEIIVGYGAAINVNYINIEISDIDNDGFKDIIAERKINGGTSSNLFWFKNDNLNFYPFQINIYNENPNFVDIENDGDFDIVCKDSSGGISFISNTNNGTFINQQILNSTQINFSFDTIKLLDFNNDGLKDIVIYNHNSPNGIKLFLKNSNNTYNSQTILSGDFNYVTFIDYDNDNDLDVLVNKGLLQNCYTRIYYNNSSSFTTNISINNKLQFDDGNDNYYTGDKILFFDLNNDNLKDLVYCTNNRIGFLKNLTSNNFMSKIISDYSMGNAIICNFDNDNFSDIVLKETSDGTQNPKISWFKNLTNLNFSQTNIEEISNNDFKINCGDINNDNDIDILSGRLYYEIQNNNIINTTTISSILSPTNLIDFDNDNDLDIIGFDGNAGSGFGSNILLFKNNSTATSFINQNLISSIALDNFKVVDIDNDGDKDIISTLLNSSKLNINNNNSFTNINLNTSMKNSFDVGDIDNDGDKDIICSDDNYLKILYNLGSNNFNLVNLSSDIAYPTLNDIDNDGDLDIIGYNMTSKRTILLLNSNQVFNSINVGNYIRDTFTNYNTVYSIMDLDNDGDKDIVMSSLNELIVYSSNFSTLATNNFTINEDYEILIYPNPVKDSFRIKTNQNIIDLQLFDIFGKKIKNLTFSNNDIDISGLDKGIYLVKVQTVYSTKTIKLIKE